MTLMVGKESCANEVQEAAALKKTDYLKQIRPSHDLYYRKRHLCESC